MFFGKQHKGPYAMQGFGLDVPYTDAQGSTKMASASTGSLCSTAANALALQAMLADLGYYTGKVDGIMGTGTRDAVKAFAAAQGIDPGVYYSGGAICQSIMDAYEAKHAPAPAAAPAASPLVGGGRLFLSPAILAAFAKSTPRAGTTPAVAPAAPAPGVMGWWGAQSTTMKIGIGVGAAAVLALGIYAAVGGKAATPNKRRKAMHRRPPSSPDKKRLHAWRRAYRDATPKRDQVRVAFGEREKPRAGSRAADDLAERWLKSHATPNPRKTGKRRPKSRCAITGVRTCRCKPPKGYPKKRSAYALPECWMYPLTTRAKVRNAASRFGKYKHRYAPLERAKIERRIDRAKQKFHIGEYR